MAGSALAQVTAVVRSVTRPSAYVPRAASCAERPAGRNGAEGTMLSETSGAGVTVTVATPEYTPTDAVTRATPAATPDTMPPALTVATDGWSTLHAASFVTSSTELSDSVPDALSERRP